MNFKRIDRPLLDIESTSDFFSSKAEDYYFPGKITNIVFDTFKDAKNNFDILGLTFDRDPGSTLLESETSRLWCMFYCSTIEDILLSQICPATELTVSCMAHTIVNMFFFSGIKFLKPGLAVDPLFQWV